MNLIAETLAEFGRTLGLSDLAPDEAGGAHFGLPEGGGFGVAVLETARDAQALVYRSEPLPYPDEPRLRASLRLAHSRFATEWPLQAGIADDTLVLSLRMVARRFTLDALERALDELERLHARIHGRA